MVMPTAQQIERILRIINVARVMEFAEKIQVNSRDIKPINRLHDVLLKIGAFVALVSIALILAQIFLYTNPVLAQQCLCVYQLINSWIGQTALLLIESVNKFFHKLNSFDQFIEYVKKIPAKLLNYSLDQAMGIGLRLTCNQLKKLVLNCLKNSIAALVVFQGIRLFFHFFVEPFFRRLSRVYSTYCMHLSATTSGRHIEPHACRLFNYFNRNAPNSQSHSDYMQAAARLPAGPQV